ncbi:MAG: MptD family putative ECF transporter S component [Oscillochloris sp.]|nr:MptD family putative ECF transporter S component [Oscillochloris sp.]
MKSTSARLNIRDLVLIGVLTALMLVVGMTAGMLTMPFMSLGLLFGSAFSAIFETPIYLLIAFKVGKRGTILIISVVRGIFYSLMGFPHMFVILLPAALIGELLMPKAELYRSIQRNTLTWMVFTAIYSLHGAILLWVFGGQYFATNMSSMFTSEQLALMDIYYFNPLIVLGIMLISAGGAALGSWIGWNLLKRHFIKSGVVQASA